MQDLFRTSRYEANPTMLSRKCSHRQFQLTFFKKITANVRDLFKAYNISCLGIVALPKYPYEEECVGQWFKLTKEEEEENDEEKKIVQVINIKIHKKEIIEYPPQSDTMFPNRLPGSNYELFFHGTDHSSAKSILEDGISLSKGAPNQDFSSNWGFYLSKNIEEALNWARHRYSKPAVLVFKINIDALTQGLDLQADEKQWENTVSSCRSGQNKKFLKNMRERFEFIEGPMASVSRNRNRHLTHPRMKENSYQLCILSKNLAEKFDTCLHSLVFYAKME